MARLAALLSLLTVLSITTADPLRGQGVGSPYGINVHAPQNEQLERLFDSVERAGISWVRIDFIWAWVEPERGVFDWQVYDDIVAAAAARHLEVLAMVAFTPEWATDGPPFSGVPRDPREWEAFCQQAAERYGGRIRFWEVWNEPNLSEFWAGTRREYLDVILTPGARAIRAARSDAQIGGPALAHLTSGERDWYAWLAAVLQEAADDLDFLTHHAYDRDGPDDLTEKLDGRTIFGSDPAGWALVAPSLREVLDAFSWSGPVWLTETGWTTSRLDEQRQALYYRGFLDQWFAGDTGRAWLSKVFFYELIDDPRPEVSKYGILSPNERPKPAYEAYRGFIDEYPPPRGVVPHRPVPRSRAAAAGTEDSIERPEPDLGAGVSRGSRVENRRSRWPRRSRVETRHQ